MHNKVTINWVQGEHDFALNIGELRALQKNCDAGPELILTRLKVGSWKIDDIFETLRLGLIGAGMDAKEAGPMVRRAFDQHPAFALKLPAYQVLAAALIGEADDPVGEEAGVKPEADSGSSPSSTEPGQ
ncbi:gene transfer agent family protein [Donghicola eburneus]|uniref:gene transfer agent family protein n=1 Tax=Donghicola eburneus TaxID=393278 RepID=UPI0008E4C287|nr:gene transfer agent family protein [Donghicola eburneus]SFQ52490.1 Phage tail tube protein, GTA-gp10 [Donghicola eburneus]